MAVQYLVPCTCGLKSAVTASQAGQRIRCKCGATVDVPPMRRLATLERAGAEADRPQPLSSLRWALVFLGVVILLFAVSMIGYLYFNRPSLNLEPIRREIAGYNLAESWQVWKHYETFGLVHRDTLLSQAYRNERATIDRWLTLGAVVAAVGLSIAVTGLFVSPARPRADVASSKGRRKRRRR